MKPSEMWEIADKELTQVKGSYGDVSEKKACAYGALVYYVTDGAFVEPTNWRIPSKQNDTLAELRTQLRSAGMSSQDITEKNDYQGWTFKQFIDWAKEHGI